MAGEEDIGAAEQSSSAGRSPAFTGWVIYAAIAAVVIVGFFMIIGTGRGGSGSSAVRASPQSGAGDLAPGSPAPDFTATAFDGSTVKLSALKGSVVLVNFFASWCIDCRVEFPAIQSAYQDKHARGFEVIAVDTWDNGEGKDFYKQMGATFPAVSDPQQGQRPGAIAHAFGIDTPSLPISVFIDRQGKIHQVFPGGIDAALIKSQLSQMGIS